MHGNHRHTAQLALLDGEAERVLGLLGAVDTNDDLLHRSWWIVTTGPVEAEVPRFRSRAVNRAQGHSMATNTQMIEQAEIDLETARGQFVALQLNPAVDDGTKLLAGAIAQAGAEIALAIARPASAPRGQTTVSGPRSREARSTNYPDRPMSMIPP